MINPRIEAELQIQNKIETKHRRIDLLGGRKLGVKSIGSSTGVSSPKSDCKRRRRIRVIEVTVWKRN